MARLIASVLGSGLILRKVRGSDGGSGTIASFFVFPISIAAGEIWGWPAQIALLILVTVLGVWAVGHLRSEGDAGWIVVDEAAGTILATIGLGWGAGLIALIVFRLADILKRSFPGVAQAESLPGPTGIIADDLVAGLYGLVAGHLVAALT